MKKLILLVFYQDKEQITQALQELGVVHIESACQNNSEGAGHLRKTRESWKTALEILRQHEHAGNGERERSGINISEIKERILQCERERDQLKYQLHALQKEEAQLRPWGNFDWEKIQKLEDSNVHFRFYSAGKKLFHAFDFDSQDDLAVEVISAENGVVRFVGVGINGKGNIPFEEVSLSKKSLREIKDAQQKLMEELKNTDSRLSNLVFAIPELEKEVRFHDDEIARLEALESYEGKANGKIEMLKGWFPTKKESVIQGFLKRHHLGYEIKNPKPKDKVPVILKNRQYPQIFEAITKIFQLPNYYEFDLTPFIAVFYPIFFAYCLGDAGYGMILVFLSAIAAFTFLRKMKGVALLGIVLGAVTMVMGIVKSGTLFGIPVAQHEEISFFSFLSQYIIVTDDQDYVFNAFNVALMIGITQILVAVIISIWRKIRYEGFVKSLSVFGKLFIIVSMIVIFLGVMQKMSFFVPYTGIAKVTLVVGILLVLLFHDTSLSIGKRVGGGMLPLYFIFTGLLGDVLSYIRLFALGVASSILGLVVNQIGSQMMEDAGGVGIALSILFLLFGHTINFALACLGAFVHPLRLTFVEFYNNAEFKGGGIEYRPFRKQTSQMIQITEK